MNGEPRRELVRQAREQVRRTLGGDLAGKATDRLCLALPVTPGPSAILEGAVVGGADSVILELEAGAVPVLPSAVIEAGPGHVWYADEPLPIPGSGASGLPRWSRLLGARALRDEFHRQVSGLCAGIEEAARPVVSSEAMSAAHPQTEACWLNQTVRAPADATVLAEVASDPNVRTIDLPRKIAPEIATTTTTVGAVDHRQETGASGKGVTIAVIDTEVSQWHPALRQRVVARGNFTREPWGFAGAHGTAVAGIAAADGELVGMAPEATIYNYKVIATFWWLSADDFGGAMALQQALEDGVDVANISWGVGPVGAGTSREAVACNTAWGLGMTVVKSAGNNGPGATTLTTPADADGVIVVGATDRLGRSVPSYSSRGPLPDGRSRPHLLAPGGTPTDGVYSCRLSWDMGPVGYGTSYAAPHVTGLLALLLEQDADLSPDQQRDLLVGGCRPLDGLDADTQGAGVVSLAEVGAGVTPELVAT